MNSRSAARRKFSSSATARNVVSHFSSIAAPLISQNDQFKQILVLDGNQKGPQTSCQSPPTRREPPSEHSLGRHPAAQRPRERQRAERLRNGAAKDSAQGRDQCL